MHLPFEHPFQQQERQQLAQKIQALQERAQIPVTPFGGLSTSGGCGMIEPTRFCYAHVGTLCRLNNAFITTGEAPQSDPDPPLAEPDTIRKSNRH